MTPYYDHLDHGCDPEDHDDSIKCEACGVTFYPEDAKDDACPHCGADLQPGDEYAGADTVDN